MTAAGPPEQQQSQPAPEELPPPVSAVERANRMSAANMLRSLAPLVLICLAFVGWLAFLRQDDDGEPVPPIDPGPSVARAAEYADYPLEAPVDLPEGYRATDTDVTGGPEGPVTLRIDYVTPSDEYVAFATSDDPEAPEVAHVLRGAQAGGTAEIGGRDWTRSTTGRGETVLCRQADGVTVLVTGSGSDEELEAVAAAVRPAC